MQFWGNFFNIIFVFSDPENLRETKLKSFKKEIRTLSGDDVGDPDALGSRYLRELFQYHIHVQRPRKPPSN